MATGSGNRPKKLTSSQVRAARRSRRSHRRRLVRWIGFSAVGAVSLAFIGALLIPGLPGPGNGGGFGTDTPEGPGIRIEVAGRDHITRGEQPEKFTSRPSTSGQHYADSGSPTTWGIHDTFIPDVIRNHNLEHGGVGIHYDCPEKCPELVTKLTDITNRAVRDEGLKVLLSPYPNMNTRIVLTAWTFLDAFDVFDEQRIIDFIQAHESSANSPEPFAR